MNMRVKILPRVSKLDTAAEVARTIERETGKLPNRETIAAVANVSYGTASNAIRVMKAQGDARMPPLPTFTKAQDYHVAARIKLEASKLQETFDERVRLKVLEENKSYLARLDVLEKSARRQKEYYDALINHHQPTFTDAEYRDLLLCTHEGNPSKEVRERAFIALNAKKLQLTGRK